MQRVIERLSRSGQSRSGGRRGRRLGVAAIASSLVASTIVIVAVVPEIAHADTITVNSTADVIAADGACTFREAVFTSNGSTTDCGAGSLGSDTINFNITSGASPIKTIVTTTALPALTNTVFVDGTTQPGWASNAPKIEIRGQLNTNLLYLQGANSEVRGLILNGAGGSTGPAAIVAGPGSVIAGNWIGLDNTGATGSPASNNYFGVRILGTPNVRVGGPNPGDRNVISGNRVGVEVEANGGVPSPGAVIEGNYIGTNVLGTAEVPNLGGVELFGGAAGTQILRNVISGNDSRGISIYGPNSNGVSILGNKIGTNAAGLLAVPNDDGIYIEGSFDPTTPISGTIIGDGTVAGRNIISGNDMDGIALWWYVANSTIQGNYIGTDVNGAGSLGNGLAPPPPPAAQEDDGGIVIRNYGNRNTIGGDVPGQGNLISNNRKGVIVYSGERNRVVGNSIANNQLAGLVISGAEVNDDFPGAEDIDGSNLSANYLQNYPIISGQVNGGNLVVNYSINSLPAYSNYPITIHLYEADSAASGEGARYFGQLTALAPGLLSANLGPAATLGISPDDRIVATATTVDGNTSNFSAVATVTNAPLVVVSTQDVGDSAPGDSICAAAGGCTLRAAIQEANATPGADVIRFNISSGPGPVKTIAPRSTLPIINGNLTIDGLTQPGSACSSPPILNVELDASVPDIDPLLPDPPALADALSVQSGSLTLRGLVINGYSNNGVVVNGPLGGGSSSGSVFECNLFGVDATGLAPKGGIAATAIFLNASSGNRIGGPSPTQRNVFAGPHIGEYLRIAAADNNVVQGNYLGTNVNKVAIGGTPNRGILLSGTGNLIGGTGAGEGNVITGIGGHGISIDAGPTAQILNSVRGNSIFGNAGMGIDIGFDNKVNLNHVGVVTGPNDYQNFPLVSIATFINGQTRVAGTLATFVPNRAYEIDVFQNSPDVFGNPCDSTGFGEGQTYLGTVSTSTGANGVATFDGTLSTGSGEPAYITTTATDMVTGATSEFSYCRRIIPSNVTWANAQPVTSGANTQQFITDTLQERWFKIPVNPGDKVKVQLTGAPGSAVSLHRDPNPIYNALTNPSSAAALSAEAADTAFLPSGSLPSGSLPSGSLPSGSLPSGSLPSGSLERGFLPSGSLPSGSLPSGSLPSGSLPSGSLPSGSLPSGSLPSGSLPSGSLPSGSLPSGSLPSGSLPSGSLPSGSLPSGSLPSGSLDAYSSAARRSLMGISMDPYAQVQTIERTTFDLQESLYVRVVGPYSLTTPFAIAVTVTGGVCSNLQPISGSLPVIAPASVPVNTNRQTVIVTDKTRMPGTLAEKNAAIASLTTLQDRSDVNGVIIDLSDTAKFPRVAAANVQADANQNCPAAKNTVAKEIKAVIDVYRKANSTANSLTSTTLQYVVLAGGADVIPFYQVQDIAGLASEKDYVPPVKPETPSEASLRSGLVKGQDFYGSSVDLTIGSRTLAVPDLAVGRLVDTAVDISAAVTAYVATGGTVTPTTSLVTGYDFVGDAADQVRQQFAAATATTPDTLIQPPGQGATGPLTWSADQLRTKLLARNNGVMMLSGHFSAGTLLAADYRTSLSAADLSTSTANFTNSVILALGCHGGFSLPSTDLLAGASPDPDWAKMFVRKGAAAYVAATGYAYGDTELTEYGERLFVGLTKQMRTGTGPIAMGKALVEAKRDYLAATAQVTGIDEKTVVEMTLYGLPMMKVNMPGARLSPPAESTLPGSVATVSSGPGVAIGLGTRIVNVTTPTTRTDVSLANLDVAGQSVGTTYYTGRDGVVANPNEPILPKQVNDATVGGQVLRGVALRSGDYTDVANVIPLTTAPATETSRPHQSYSSDVFYPNQVWMPNYYDAVDGGPTRLITVPAQYRSTSPGSTAGTMRTYSNVNLALYYMPANWTAPASSGTAKAAAVGAGPSVTGVSASANGTIVSFSVNAQTDGSAGVQAVWVVYTADSGTFYGHWQPADLTRSAIDPTLWTGTLNIGSTPAADMHFMVQAVNGAGLTALATNLGGYYSVAASATPPAPAAATNITLTGPPSGTGTYQTAQTFSARLTSLTGAGLGGQTLYFDVGGAQKSAVTALDGTASVTLTPVVPPGSYTAQVSSKSNATYKTANASQPFTVTKANSALTLTVPTTPVVAGQPTGISATLKNGTRALDGKSIAFVLTGTTQVVRVAATDNNGVATLPPLTGVPVGTYSVKAYFGGGAIAGVSPALVLPADDLYNASASSAANYVVSPTVVPNQAPVVKADMGVPGLQDIGYQTNVVVLAGTFTDADGVGPFTASVRWTPTGAFTPFVLNNNTGFIAAFVYPSAGTRVATVRVCDKAGACGTDDVTIRTSVSQKVTPVRECVVDRGSATNPRYQARFGYNNPAGFAIYVPTLLSAENGFNTIPFDRGQPQVFQPGNPRNVFTTTFNTGAISWKLNGTTVTANSSSPRC